MFGISKPSAKSSANMHDRDKKQALEDRQLILQNQAKLAQYKAVTEERNQQLQAQYEKLELLGFPKARTEDERLKNFWLLVNTGHPKEAQQHYSNPVELESQSDMDDLIKSLQKFNFKRTSSASRPSARTQSTIPKHSASSAPRASANFSPSPHHNRTSASARPSAQPSRIIDKNYRNYENWLHKNVKGKDKYRFVDPDNRYKKYASVEKYKKIMGILPPNPNTGGSRKRSRRHSKKQKRVRHTRRKQTRRHRHRHSRHRR
jgi:hypothetical protein